MPLDANHAMTPPPTVSSMMRPGRALGGDNRLGCAILLALARQLIPLAGDHAPVTLVFFVQEEVGLVGARGLDLTLLGSPFPAMCINLDGGPVHELVTAVTGTERFTVDIAGIPAHAGRPAGGVSAAVIMAMALAELQQGGWHGRIERNAGRGSANVGIVEGGQGSNVVMPALNILAEARSHDPDFSQADHRHLEKRIHHRGKHSKKRLRGYRFGHVRPWANV